MNDYINVKAFVLAAQRGNVEKVKLGIFQLIEIDSSCDIDSSDGRRTIVGSTALHEASANGHVEIIDLLLDRQASINKKTRMGWTPLHAATWNGQRKTAIRLVERGARIDLQDYAGFTPIAGARENGGNELADELERLHASLQRNHRQPQSQPQPQQTPINKMTMEDFFGAIASGNLEKIKLGLQQGIDIHTLFNYRVNNTFYYITIQCNALHYAAAHGQVAVMNFLLDSGFRVNDRAAEVEWTALHFAAREGEYQAAKGLVARGANIRALDSNGLAPSCLASKLSDDRVCAYLEDLAIREDNARRAPQQVSAPVAETVRATMEKEKTVTVTEVFHRDVNAWPLSDSVTSRVFSFLPSADLVSAASVCQFFKRFSDASARQVLIKEYGIDAEEFAEQESLKVLRKIEHLFKPVSTFKEPSCHGNLQILTHPRFVIDCDYGILSICKRREDEALCFLMTFATPQAHAKLNSLHQCMGVIDANGRVEVRRVTDEAAAVILAVPPQDEYGVKKHTVFNCQTSSLLKMLRRLVRGDICKESATAEAIFMHTFNGGGMEKELFDGCLAVIRGMCDQPVRDYQSEREPKTSCAVM